MQLKDVLQHMVQESLRAGQLTDICIGTVTSVMPLEITINTQMAPLRRSVLYLTESVIEKKLPVLEHFHEISSLSHSHSTEGGTTGEGLTGTYQTQNALEGIACVENGVQLPIENGFIILNRALQMGDKVMLLRVQNGQKFIVLSRVF